MLVVTSRRSIIKLNIDKCKQQSEFKAIKVFQEENRKSLEEDFIRLHENPITKRKENPIIRQRERSLKSL